MAQSVANLVDHVLPKTPLRQFVITFPFELRARLAYDGKLLAAVTRIVVQRVSSDLKLNPHLHTILLDGVFVADNGSPVFHPLPQLHDSDLADLLQVIRVRLVNFLLRRGIIESRQELTLLDDDFADREPEWNLQRSGRFHGGRRSSRSEERAKRVVNPPSPSSLPPP